MAYRNANYGAPAQVTPSVVKTLLIANAIGFLLISVVPGLFVHFALWPLGQPEMARGQFFPWQLLSYGFLHGSVPHLMLNMFGCWMFGSPLERLWGSKPFALYFLTCVIGAGLIQLAVTGPGAPTVGASGGVFGLLLGFGMMYPNRTVMLIFPPIPMKAKYFVVVFGAIELSLGLTSSQSTIAHFAHVGGMLFGFLLIHYWRGNLPIKPNRQLMR